MPHEYFSKRPDCSGRVLGEVLKMPESFIQTTFLGVHMYKVQKSLLALGLMAGIASAHAALPTEATAAFSAIKDNVTDVLAAIWPIVALATGGFVLVKLFKKGANKAV